MQRLAVCLAFLLIATAVAEPGLAGKYVGEWKSSGSNGGAIRFTLDGPHAEIWHADLTFVLGGAEVPTVMRDVKVKVSNIDLTYDFDTQGATLRSHVTGDWDGAAFKGKYETTAGGTPVDSGTWTAVREKAQ